MKSSKYEFKSFFEIPWLDDWIVRITTLNFCFHVGEIMQLIFHSVNKYLLSIYYV